MSYLFTKQGEIIVHASGNKDKLMDNLIDAGVEDIIETEDDHLICITQPDEYHHVLYELHEKKIDIDQSQLAMHPQNLIQVKGDEAETLEKLIDALEDLDDVQQVYFNAEFA